MQNFTNEIRGSEAKKKGLWKLIGEIVHRDVTTHRHVAIEKVLYENIGTCG